MLRHKAVVIGVTVDNEVMQFINNVQDDRRELFLKLHTMILKLYPDIGMKISYNIPKYSYSNDEWLFVSYNKLGVTLHVGYKGNIPGFSAKYPKFKTGKACVHFKPNDDIPWKDVEALIKTAVKR